MGLKISGSKKELKQSREADQQSRDVATTILNPDQIQGKAWKTAKVLETTLGLAPREKARNITKKDLLAFNANIKALQSKVVSGITASEIIRFSTKEDKDRSRKQIHFAVPHSIKGGNIYFVTDAGGTTKGVSRHNVHVILSEYEIGLAKGTPLQGAKEAAKGRLKFDCSCKQHTFIYRYISTIMGANSGRPETGFPKIKNPHLTGIACKHVLRVMVELDSSIFIWKKIAKTIESDRLRNAGKTTSKRQKTISLTQKEANELAKRQGKKRRSLATAKYKASESDRNKIAKERTKASKHKKVKRNSKATPLKNMVEVNAEIERLKLFGVSPELIKSVRQDLIKKNGIA